MGANTRPVVGVASMVDIVPPGPSPTSLQGVTGGRDADSQKTHNDDKIPNYNKIITSLVAGACAGALAKSAIAPFDRTKINFQISNRSYSFKKAIRFLVNTVKTDGALALWRGNSATLVRIVPYASIQFAAHEQWKAILNAKGEKYGSPSKRFLAGSLAGVTSVSCTYPLDMARARMAVTNQAQYSNLIQVFLKIYRTEGIRTVYRGFVPTILGSIPYSGMSFFTYETCKKVFSDLNNNREPKPYERMCFGAISGLFGQTSSYPLDIVRRRMQTAGVTGLTHEYRSIYSTIVYVLKTEGFMALYKGLSMNWIKGPISVGISFTTFDIVQMQLRKLTLFHVD